MQSTRALVPEWCNRSALLDSSGSWPCDNAALDCRNKLFVFLKRRDAEPTNNESERALRPSVIFRKVTNGFRSLWGAKVYAHLCSIVCGLARVNHADRSANPLMSLGARGSIVDADPQLPGLDAPMTLSDSRRGHRPVAMLRPLPSPATGLPRLPPFRRAAPTTPADQAGARRLLPRSCSLPQMVGGSAS
jgi:hypothetical protein